MKEAAGSEIWGMHKMMRFQWLEGVSIPAFASPISWNTRHLTLWEYWHCSNHVDGHEYQGQIYHLVLS